MKAKRGGEAVGSVCRRGREAKKEVAQNCPSFICPFTSLVGVGAIDGGRIRKEGAEGDVKKEERRGKEEEGRRKREKKGRQEREREREKKREKIFLIIVALAPLRLSLVSDSHQFKRVL